MASGDPIVTGVAGRYATALFELAKDEGQLDQAEADLTRFEGLLDESEDLTRLVRSPVFSAESQGRALHAILQAAGISGLTANFLLLLAKNRRLFAAGDVTKAFRTLLANQRGEMTAEVSSAAALSDEEQQALTAALRDRLGKDVRLRTKVDPALLGGLVVKIGSRMIDTSIRTKLNNLKLAMKEVG